MMILRLHVLAGHSCKLLQACNRALRPHSKCLLQCACTSKSQSRPGTFSAYNSSAAYSSQPHYSALGLDRAGHVRSGQSHELASVTVKMNHDLWSRIHLSICQRPHVPCRDNPAALGEAKAHAGAKLVPVLEGLSLITQQKHPSAVLLDLQKASGHIAQEDLVFLGLQDGGTPFFGGPCQESISEIVEATGAEV